jgi:cation diffusion facilitator CzcD-associated flavoprotein CzcO
MEIAILGAGAGGLCAATQLRRHGIDSFTIYEKSDGVGGTWRDNSYPGAACDIPSHLYSFSFERKADWSRKYAEQPEILAYFEEVTDRYGLRPHLRVGTEITEIRWLEDERRWQLTTATGEVHHADAVISGLGQLNRPYIPEISGLDTFEGTTFHSARWDHDHDLTGERVAVVGTGASAIQFVPPVAEQARQTFVFQRTPNWLVPKEDAAFSPATKAAFRLVPGLDRLYRSFLWARQELSWLNFAGNKQVVGLFEKLTGDHLRDQVPDDSLRQRSTPGYPIGCKRVLISSDWYPTLQRDDVELVEDPIVRVEADAVVTADGTRREVDAIVFGTGFRTTEFLVPMEVLGRDGTSIHDAWKGGARAHLGVTVPGFPNLFLLYGPNTNLAHNSIILMIECQVRHVLACLEQVRQRGRSAIEPTVEAAEAFDAETQGRVEKTVWAAGCPSWYKNDEGRITNNWSGSTIEFWKRTRKADWSQFTFS